MKMKNIAAVAMAGCMAASLAACGGSASSAASSAASTEAATSEAAEATGISANGFTVQLGPNPETLDPALNSAIDGANTIITTFEPLLLIDENNEVVPGQAELPVGGGLVHKGIQKFPQVFFRGIIQRSQHRDGGQTAVCRRFSGHLCALGFQHLFGGQVAGLFAKTAALDKARAPLEHGRQALVLGQLHGISSQLSGTFQSQVHTHASPRWVAL